MIRAGQGIILIALALLSVGVVMVTSAGLTIGDDVMLDLREVLLGRTALFAAIAAVMLAVGALVPVERLGRARGPASPALWLTALIILLLLMVHVPGVGREVNGARRWVAFGPVGFQPSEVAKWGLLIVLAWYATRHRAAMHELPARRCSSARRGSRSCSPAEPGSATPPCSYRPRPWPSRGRWSRAPTGSTGSAPSWIRTAIRRASATT
jgi:hypothetical protein